MKIFDQSFPKLKKKNSGLNNYYTCHYILSPPRGDVVMTNEIRNSKPSGGKRGEEGSSWQWCV